MANVIKPKLFVRIRAYPDGRRKDINVFLLIRMANKRKPMCAVCVFELIRTAKIIKPMFVCLFGLILLANAMKPMLLCIKASKATKTLNGKTRVPKHMC